jgi:hypothetical protein
LAVAGEVSLSECGIDVYDPVLDGDPADKAPPVKLFS